MRIGPILTAIIVSVVVYLFVMERETLLAIAGADAPEVAAEEVPLEEARPAVLVQAIHSKAQPVDSGLVFRGRTEAFRLLDVKSETSGQIISQPLRKGLLVEEGELLCELDPGTKKAALSEAKARLAEAKANKLVSEELVKKGFTSETDLLSREAARSFARVVRVKGDQAGAEIMRALIERVRATPRIQVLEGVLACGLDSDGTTVRGVAVELARPEGSAPVMLRGAGILLAGGGSGGLYALTTNPARIRGQVIGMAARAGALIADAEFVQFHPTALYNNKDGRSFLISEAVRGFGAILRDKNGHRFMPDYDKRAELASRDIVSQSIDAELKKSGDSHVFLDCTHLDTNEFKKHFPNIYP